MEQAAVIDETSELEELRARKQKLSIDVINGNEAARTECTKITQQIMEIEQEFELRILANEEQKRRDSEQQRLMDEEARRAKEELCQSKITEWNDKFLQLQNLFATLVDPIEEALAVGREAYAL